VAAAEAYLAVTLTAHQLHGGIGFATDHDLHLWSDRAVAAAIGRRSRHEHLRTITAERPEQRAALSRTSFRTMA
jgi:alkylation response protein AidB-like acyl-CoA dehydrogenase